MLCRACRAELGKGSKKPGEQGERDRQMDERGCSRGQHPRDMTQGQGLWPGRQDPTSSLSL